MCTRSVMLHLPFSVKVEEQLGSPVDLYLEGQDQHRGWYGSQTWHAVRARVHSNAFYSSTAVLVSLFTAGFNHLSSLPLRSMTAHHTRVLAAKLL